jgi:hypothetical protein
MTPSLVRRGGLATTLAVSLALALTVSVLAIDWQAEGGTKNCGATIGYVHARYNDYAALQGPGGSTGYYGLDNGTWQISERNGSCSGDWLAMGTPYLDLVNTWAGCRNYG